MRGVVEVRPAPPTAVPPARTSSVRILSLALPVGALGLAAAALVAGDATAAGPVAWIGSAAALAAAAGLAAGALRLVPLPSPGAPGLALAGLLAAYAAWSGATIAWSVAPDRSWDAVNRSLSYLALVLLGMLAAALLRRPVRAAAGASACLLGVVVAWSLAGKVVPALGGDVDHSARLTGPLAYWNALALAAAFAVPLWLWLAARPVHHPLLRAAAAAALTWSATALLLTGSRGGLVVAGLAALVWLALSARRLEGAFVLALAGAVGGAAGVWAITRPGLAQAGADLGERTRDGALLGVLLVASALAVAALTLAAARAEERAPLSRARRRTSGAAAALAAAALVVAVTAGLVVRAGGPEAVLDAFRNPPEEQVTQEPGARLADPSSNHRWTWWNEALEISADHRLGGAGAGSFELARRPLRADTRAPVDPHNLGLKALAETGAVGLVLLLGLVAAGAWTVGSALRRLAGAERAAAGALAAVAAAWLAHAVVDMTWELVAVTAPVLLLLGVLAAAGRPAARPGARRPLAAVAVLGLAAAVVVALASPRLAERRADAAVSALADGRLTAAAEHARDAGSLNPLAVEPLHLEALAAELAGRHDEAERLYRRAAQLQPANPVTWYELGRFEYEVRDNPSAALVYLDRAWGLDPWSRPTGRLLDAVRADLAGA